MLRNGDSGRLRRHSGRARDPSGSSFPARRGPHKRSARDPEAGAQIRRGLHSRLFGATPDPDVIGSGHRAPIGAAHWSARLLAVLAVFVLLLPSVAQACAADPDACCCCATPDEADPSPYSERPGCCDGCMDATRPECPPADGPNERRVRAAPSPAVPTTRIAVPSGRSIPVPAGARGPPPGSEPPIYQRVCSYLL